MEELNQKLFLLMNASVHPASAQVLAATLLAQWVIYIAAVVPVGLWLWGDKPTRTAALAAMLSVTFALAVAQAIGLLWPHPRPFMMGIANKLITHSPDSSFPSDHATFLFAMGASLIGATLRKTGWLVIGLGVVVGWSRVYLGIHFPFDIVGGLLVGVLSALIVSRLMTFKGMDRRLLGRTEQCYRRFFALPISKGWMFP